MAHLLSVNIAAVTRTGDWTGDKGETGIDKRPVTQRVRLFDHHVEGDHVVDRKHHGGEFQAVYAYAREDAQWWERELGRAIPSGAFGENLTTFGVDLTHAVVGETWRIGSAVLRVTDPRIPCRVFAGFWDRPNLIKEFSAAARPGTYLSIVEEGDVAVGDVIEVLDQPMHGVTVGMVFRAHTGGDVERTALEPALEWMPPKTASWVRAGL